MKSYTRITLIVLAVACMVGIVSTALAEELTIVGTGDGMVIFENLGRLFSRMHPEITITIPESVGSSGGIKTVGRDEYLLGRVAREIGETEKHYGLTQVIFAKIPVVFFVNKNAGVQGLSTQQILDIYSGKTTNWKELGGNDVKIRVVTREEGDSNFVVIQKLFPGFADITVTARSKTTFSESETMAIVEKTGGVISYGNYAEVRIANVDILQVDGKSAADPTYPYVTTLGLIFKERNYTGSIKLFVEFVTSDAEVVHEAIKEAGGTPF